MSRNENAIFTNMCMVYDKEKILIQNRLNINWPGVTFPGGHVEYAESFTNSVIWEVFESDNLSELYYKNENYECRKIIY